MVLIGLLLVALVCLVVGLILASAPVAGRLAGRQRGRGLSAVRASASSSPRGPAHRRTRPRPRRPRRGRGRWSRTRRRRAGRRAAVGFDAATAPIGSEAASGRRPSPDAEPTANPEQQVWVVDTLPQFHTRGLRRDPEPRLRGHPARAGGRGRLHRVHGVQAGAVGRPLGAGLGRRRPSRLSRRGLPQPEDRGRAAEARRRADPAGSGRRGRLLAVPRLPSGRRRGGRYRRDRTGGRRTTAAAAPSPPDTCRDAGAETAGRAPRSRPRRRPSRTRRAPSGWSTAGRATTWPTA